MYKTIILSFIFSALIIPHTYTSYIERCVRSCRHDSTEQLAERLNQDQRLNNEQSRRLREASWKYQDRKLNTCICGSTLGGGLSMINSLQYLHTNWLLTAGVCIESSICLSRLFCNLGNRILQTSVEFDNVVQSITQELSENEIDPGHAFVFEPIEQETHLALPTHSDRHCIYDTCIEQYTYNPGMQAAQNLMKDIRINQQQFTILKDAVKSYKEIKCNTCIGSGAIGIACAIILTPQDETFNLISKSIFLTQTSIALWDILFCISNWMLQTSKKLDTTTQNIFQVLPQRTIRMRNSIRLGRPISLRAIPAQSQLALPSDRPESDQV